MAASTDGELGSLVTGLVVRLHPLRFAGGRGAAPDAVAVAPQVNQQAVIVGLFRMLGFGPGQVYRTRAMAGLAANVFLAPAGVIAVADRVISLVQVG